ncbi:hypothetical protein ACFTTY_37445, partial [Streptomyces sp. NPDC056937]
MSLSYTLRPGWAELPGGVRAAVENRAGSPVVSSASAVGGFTPGMAATLRLGTGDEVFVKAVGPGHPGITEMMNAERRINAVLPAMVPAPALLWSLSCEEWTVLGFEAVVGRHPELSPASSDTGQVLGVLETLSSTPCPDGVQDAPTRFTGWRDSGAWPERAAELAWWEERCS